MPKKVIIMGAAGRDFHNFNVLFRNNTYYKVVAFTAAQIPEIDDRIYPPELSGKLYPKGIKIYPEEKLPELIKRHKVDEVFFSYSDVSYDYVMEKASLVLSCRANLCIAGYRSTALKSFKPVISVCAVRTGCGKSQTTRRVCEVLKSYGLKPVVLRHPMPYGDLKKQIVQKFSSYEDLVKYDCTIEEREEYEPHIKEGNTVYAGIDYGKILKRAEKEADVIVWDGGNNDFPFLLSDLHIVVTDPHRVGHELKYYPGKANLMMADVVVINKENTSYEEDIEKLKENIKKINSTAVIVDANSPVYVEDPMVIKNKKVLVIEDGPTLTHGDMPFGAGYIAAEKFAKRIIDPRPYAVGSIKKTFEKYPHLEKVLPAVGYSRDQIRELQETINRVPCDAVVIGTPIDISRFMLINKPHTRVFYELEEIGTPNLKTIIRKFLQKKKII